MKKLVVLLLILSFSLYANINVLKINSTFSNKPYKLYSVYSYKEDVDKPIGFLGYKLKRVIEDDSSAVWQLRKYQAARLVGSASMFAGVLSMFFKDFKLTRAGKVGVNVLVGVTLMSLGYGIGFKYAYYSLNNAVDTFNKNNEKKEKKSYLLPTFDLDKKRLGLKVGLLF